MRPPRFPTPPRPFRRAATAASIAAAALVAGCGSGEVREADRDTTGRYDGTWTATVEEGQRSWQTFGTWRVRCESEASRSTFDVDGGALSWRADFGEGTETFTTWVDADGDFRVEMPFTRRSDTSHRDGENFERFKLIYRGTLDEAPTTGSYVFGYAQFGYQGCRYRVRYERA